MPPRRYKEFVREELKQIGILSTEMSKTDPRSVRYHKIYCMLQNKIEVVDTFMRMYPELQKIE